MKLKLPKILKDFNTTFTEKGFQCYLVGGAVRNMISGRDPGDYDFATDALPEDVIKLFKRVIPTGIKHGTVTVLYRDHSFEVTTFRLDNKYSNKRHPDSVSFTPSLIEDLKRRDFTINALACNIATGEVIDPGEGISDLKMGILRSIGSPLERFSEDSLRLLRACRFSAQLEFSLEKNTKQAMIQCRNGITFVSAERIRDELVKSLTADKPSLAFKAMEETGLLELVLPELDSTKNLIQDDKDGITLFQHLLYTCDRAPKTNIPVRLAALFHDLGKVESFKFSEGKISYPKHEIISSDLSKKILQRLKFPNVTIERVSHLILFHMITYTENWTDSAVRRFIHRVRIPYLEDLFILMVSDFLGKEKPKGNLQGLKAFQNRIDSILSEDSVFSLKDLAINGEILQKELGIPRGPIIGIILKELLDTVLDDPSQNNREVLLNISSNLFKKITSGMEKTGID